VLISDFRRRYEQVFGPGTSLPEAGLETGTFRLEGRAPSPAGAGGGRSRTPAPTLAGAWAGRRSAAFSAGRSDVAMYDGELLPGGAVIAGPAIVDCPGTTVVIGPGQRAEADADGNIVITTGQERP